MTSSKRKDSKGRILKSGEYERKNGRYEYRTTQNGEVYTITATSLQELRTKEKELEKKLAQGVRPKSITLETAIDYYLEESAGKDRTMENYAYWKKSICKYPLSKMKLDTIKKNQCLKFIHSFLDEYAASYVLNICNFIHAVFKWAVNENYVQKNPMDFRYYTYIQNIKPIHKRDRLYPEQLDSLSEFLDKTETGKYWKPVFNLVLETGLRRGELCALTKDDIDLQKRTLTVSKQMVYVNGRFKVAPPKSAASHRKIPLTDEALKSLEILYSRAGDNHLILGRRGKPIDPNGLVQVVCKLRKSYNQTHDEPIEFTLHMLRHTFCSRMVENNVGIKHIQEIMGHSNITAALAIYTHTNFETKKNDFLTKMT